MLLNATDVEMIDLSDELLERSAELRVAAVCRIEACEERLMVLLRTAALWILDMTEPELPTHPVVVIPVVGERKAQCLH